MAITEMLTIDECNTNLNDRFCDARQGSEVTLWVNGPTFVVRSVRGANPQFSSGGVVDGTTFFYDNGHLYFQGTDSHSEEYEWFHEFHMEQSGEWNYRYGVASGPQVFAETGTDSWYAELSGGAPAPVTVPEPSMTALLVMGALGLALTRKFRQ